MSLYVIYIITKGLQLLGTSPEGEQVYNKFYEKILNFVHVWRLWYILGKLLLQIQVQSAELNVTPKSRSQGGFRVSSRSIRMQ